MSRWGIPMTKEEKRAKANALHRIWVSNNIDRARELRRQSYKRHREKWLLYLKEWVKKNPEKVYAGHERYRKKNPEKDRAHWLAYRIPLAEFCEICHNKAEDKHHDDYSKPYEVRHLCRKCHTEIHRKYK